MMRHVTTTKKSRHKRACLSVLLAASTVLASCVQRPAELPDWPTPTKPPASDLPVGSELINNAEPTDSELRDETTWGSIRPDPSIPLEQRVPDILKRGRIVVGVAQSLNRLGFRDPVTGDLAGFEVDIAHEIARDIFGDPNKVEFRYADSRNRSEILNSGEVDIIIRTMSVTRERQKNTEFSSPYLEAHNRLLVLANSPINAIDDLADKRICVTRNSTSASAISQFDIGELLITDTWTDCLMAMQRHQTDAVFTDDAILAGLQTQDPYTRLIDLGTNIGSSTYNVGIAPSTKSRDTRGLTQQVNMTIERIQKDGTWKRLYDEWLGDYLGSAQPPSKAYRTEYEDKELDNYRHGREFKEPGR